MAVLRTGDIDNFIKNPPPDISGILIYGPNEARIADISEQIVKSIIGSLDDPFNLVFLNESQFKEFPGVLRDEMLSLSFTGDRKVIWIKDPGTAFTRQFTGLFDESLSDNLLIVQTGQLSKSASIRKQFESSKQATSIPCYEDTPRDLITLINAKVGSENKTISTTTASLLIESVGPDRALLLSELEKLLNFCADSAEITANDVEALSSDPLTSNLDEICDLAFTGNVNGCTSKFRQLSASGIQGPQIINMLSNHLTRLQKFRVDLDKGQNADTLIKSARPPVFFKRQPSVKRQLAIWSSPMLKNALAIMFDAILLTRQNADLADSICERALITLSKKAQANSR